MLQFYNDHQAVLPIHTRLYRADVGSMKGASANVESVFSGVKRLLGDFAATMGPDVLELYVFIHYNWQYECLRPTWDEIVSAYIESYGKAPVCDDFDSDGSDDEASDDNESDDDVTEVARPAAPAPAPAPAPALVPALVPAATMPAGASVGVRELQALMVEDYYCPITTELMADPVMTTGAGEGEG